MGWNVPGWLSWGEMSVGWNVTLMKRTEVISPLGEMYQGWTSMERIVPGFVLLAWKVCVKDLWGEF